MCVRAVNMADKTELRNMVLSFRVSELQLLLGLTSQSKCGRKTELMQRALALVERGVSTQIQLKIRELYRRYTPKRYSPPPVTKSSSSSSSLLNGSHSSSSSSHLNVSSHLSGSSHRLGSVAMPQRGHASRPDVLFRRLPFYDILAEIMKPTSLVPRSSARMQEARFSFTLTPQQVEEINLSRDMRMLDRVEYSVQLQLRFCLSDTTNRQQDCFPSNICVKVNNLMAPLPNPIPTNKPGAEPKRPNRPVDITRVCRLSNAVTNTMTVAWAVEENKNYSVAIYLVKRLDSNILLQRLKRAGVRKAEYTKAMIQEKLSLDRDQELSTTSLCISLLCPLGKMRMSIPCRASTCNHLQCFDAATFIQMNEKKPTWMCPVCDKPAEFSKLVIDGLISDIVRDSTDSIEVELTKDGTWHVTKTEDADSLSPSNSPSPEREMIDDDDCPRKGEGGDCIDLTETDDEGNNSSRCQSRAAACNYTSPSPPVPVAVYDLSPLRIPMPTPPPPLPPLPPSSPPSCMPTAPPSPPPLPPMPLSNPFSYSSSQQIPLPPMPPPSLFSMTPPLGQNPYAGMGMYGACNGYDMNPGGQNADLMDFISLMSGMTDYSVGNPFLPSNAFDYLYPNAPSNNS